jgi:DNA-directed RNA polymerase specialized sigma24 family protein
MMTEATQQSALLNECEPVMEEIFHRCSENAPNFGVRLECFKESLQKTARKYILNSANEVSASELKDFLRQIQADDLFLALACANGNERAWWEFDQQHRSYLERVARHLASSEIDAQEVVDTVYVELYGTRVVDGARVSKFSTYSGRGSLRGWLRTVIWHSLVDLHRASHDEVSLENQGSPLRDWFQRKSPTREKNPESRIHESTIMRWLEKSYAKVLQLFRAELRSKHELRDDEIEICMELATQDLASRNLYQNLTTT